MAPAMKTLSFARGYAPSQWALNSNPKDPPLATADDFIPAARHDVLTDPNIEGELQIDMRRHA